jgi:hypothetical protein
VTTEGQETAQEPGSRESGNWEFLAGAWCSNAAAERDLWLLSVASEIERVVEQEVEELGDEKFV